MALSNYVKFLRGTPTAYAQLTSKDADTLYFISEKGSSIGTLYLGNMAIAGGSVSAATTLNDLTDVLIQEGLTGDSFLVYDEEKQQWTNKSVISVVSEILTVFKGATADAPGVPGLVPAPEAGKTDLFLRSDGSWAQVIATLPVEVQETIDDLETKVGTLIGTDEGLSVREIVASALIAPDAAESLNELQEIAAWIQQHPKDAAAMNKDISDLKTTVGDMNELIESIQLDIDNIIYALTWQEMNENSTTE